MSACVESGSAPNIVQECTTNSVMFSLVAVGMGIGFVTAAEPAPLAQNIRLVRIKDLGLKFGVLLAWRRRDQSAALQRFVDVMARHNTLLPSE